MINWGNIVFMIEIFLAELLFLCSAEKRSRFWLRLPAAAAASLCIANFVFTSNAWIGDPVYQLFRFLCLFGLTIEAMGVCFKLTFSSVLSSCVAGYAVQHIAYQVTALLRRTDLFADFSYGQFSRQYLLELIAFPPVYLLVFLTAGLYVIKNDWTKKADPGFNLVSLAIVFICLGLSRFARYFGDFGSVSVSLYAIVCCLLALVIQLVLYRLTDLRIENATIQLLWQDDRKQYEISKKTIETINIKYHDLKHKLSGLEGKLPEEEIKSIKDAVRAFGSQVKTGNEALDVLLTENTLRCGEEGITLTYMGNGADLSFMNVMDVYSLFGNAIDNAVEAVRKVDDPEKRVISLVSERLGGMVCINISNFFSEPLTFEDGLPVTTKKEEEGFHGFGMKSMKLIAEKYGGHISTEARGEIFSLGVYLMAK